MEIAKILFSVEKAQNTKKSLKSVSVEVEKNDDDEDKNEDDLDVFEAVSPLIDGLTRRVHHLGILRTNF